MKLIKQNDKVILVLLLTLVFGSCKREQRQLNPPPSSLTPTNTVRQSDLQPGESRPATEVKNDYEENAYAVSEGKRLYQTYNCNGCHANGGGGIGPALMDDRWIYGSSPQNIYSTIIEGRPNGMPSFASKISDDQVWQISAYVRSLSGQLRKDVSPSRDDDMNAKPAEQSTSRERPKPAPAEHPQ